MATQETDGFYSADKCAESIGQWFAQQLGSKICMRARGQIPTLMYIPELCFAVCQRQVFCGCLCCFPFWYGLGGVTVINIFFGQIMGQEVGGKHLRASHLTNLMSSVKQFGLHLRVPPPPHVGNMELVSGGIISGTFNL